MGEWRAHGVSACLCADRTDTCYFVCIFHRDRHASGPRCIFVGHDGMVAGHGPSSAIGIYAHRAVACVRYGQAVQWCASLVLKV